ncbi:MAG: RNA ligase [Myxococcales bacterium]|nr:RNA ligase [Myxococcales bacterium]
MRHRGFPKIAGPGERPGAPPPGGPWVALEKLHGAQMVVAVAGDELRFGKRKAWLADEEPFFGWQLLRAPLGAAARAARERLGRATVVLYGELYGGSYPHPDVAAVPGLTPVQTGIWYAPDLRYAVFDVLVADGEEDEGEFLSHREVAELARMVGLDSPPVLHAGARADVERVPVRYPTRMPARLGLPELSDNLAEGVVSKPDARARPSQRVVYKRKIAEFDELQFRESEAFDPNQRVDLAGLTAHGLRLVNPPRVASAASKWGFNNLGVLVDEVALDVMIDLAAAFPAAVAGLSASDEEALRTAIAAAAERRVRGLE